MNGSEKRSTSQGRRADMVVPPNDTRSPRLFLEQVMQGRVRDAWLLGDKAGGGLLLAGAAEAAEFGLGDDDRATVFHERAARHVDADPRAFAGLRRGARAAGDPVAVLELWERELDAARDPVQRVLAGVGTARAALRSGASPGEVRASLAELVDYMDSVPAELRALVDATLENVLVSLGQVEDAHRLRSQRWGLLADLLGEEGEPHAAPGALAIAVAAEANGIDGESALDWFGVAFEAEASGDALRPLLRDCLDRGDSAAAEALLCDAVARLADASERGRAQLLLGSLRAWRLEDRPGALQAWAEAMRSSELAPLAAAMFLPVARGAHGSLDVHAYVDALGAQLDLAASPVERADILSRMAVRMADEGGAAEAALDLAEEALRDDPSHWPAAALIDELLLREGRDEERARHLMDWLERTDLPSQRVRLHHALAEIFRGVLQRPAEAERHLRAVLDIRPCRRAIRELASLLAQSGRWQDLVSHLSVAAESAGSEREKGSWLARAAEVATHELMDPELAADLYATLLERVPQHANALPALAELLVCQGRWEELLALLDVEMSRFEESAESRAACACWAAEIALRRLGDSVRAEEFWRRALRDEAGNHEALDGLVGLCRRQRRWEDLAQVHELQLRAAGDDRVRSGSLLALGELYASRLGDLQRARECFDRLFEISPRHRELSLLWLERVHEALGDEAAVLATLRRRHTLVGQGGDCPRLAFRIAAHEEFVTGDAVAAFRSSVEALGDPLCAEWALDAVDRLWTTAGVDEEARRQAIERVRWVASSMAALRHRALRLLPERLLSGSDVEEDRVELWTAVADEWPRDVVAGETCAQHALRLGQFAAAESFRSTLPLGALEAVLVEWEALELGMAPGQAWEGVGLQPLRAFLARERGDSDVAFAGAEERELLQRVSVGSVTVGELLHGSTTDIERRLAICAARALGRPEDLVAGWLQHVDALEAPVLRLQALIELADEPLVGPEERRRRLSEAADLGLYDHPLRRELYDRLEALAAHEVLADALGQHIESAVALEDGHRASLSLRQARTLDGLGRRDAAVTVLRGAFVHLPADARIALEKARLETELDRLEEARETLESCLDAGVKGTERIAVLGRLAELHERRGGDLRRAIACLEDACTLSDNAPGQALRLAHAHARCGNAQRAVDLLSGVLVLAPEREDLHHWLLLARLQGQRLGREQDAESLLWSLFRRFPDSEEVLSGLEDHYRHTSDAGAFAARLGSVLLTGELAVDGERHSDLWLYLGELNASVLHNWRAAEDAFGHARRGRPSSADIRLREARAIAQQPDRESDAARRVLDMLALPEVSEEIWDHALQVLDEVYERLGDGARLGVVRQSRAACAGHRHSEVRKGREMVPERPVDRALLWHLLGRDLLEQRAVGVLRGVLPLAERVFSDRLPDRRELEAQRPSPEVQESFGEALERACRWLGCAPEKFWVSARTTAPVMLEGGGVVLPEADVLGDEGVARFLAGTVAAHIHLGAGTLIHVGDEGYREVLRAVAGRVLGDEKWADSPLCDEISGLLLTPLRRQAVQALREDEAELERDGGWVSAVEAFADRAGLVCCGDVSAAVAAIRASAPARSAEARIRDLLRFALSDAHEEARYEAGLARRPLSLDGRGSHATRLGESQA